MNKMIEDLPSKLPIEIINVILEYSGHHKWRNGKYMKQIDIDNNSKYKDILYIPQKILIENTPFYQVVFYKKYRNVLYKNVIRKISYVENESLYFNIYKLERQKTIKNESKITWEKNWTIYNQISYHYK